jgi:hypothetical protein
MAGHARFTAVLDACVLFLIATADALLSLAVEGLDAAKWTLAIEEEWLAVAERRHPDRAGWPRDGDMPGNQVAAR